MDTPDNDNENVIQMPTRTRHRRPAQEFYEAAEKADLAVWRVCAYTRKSHGDHVDDCKRCPRVFHDPDYGPCHHGCRVLAEEAIAVVLEELAHGHIELGGER